MIKSVIVALALTIYSGNALYFGIGSKPFWFDIEYTVGSCLRYCRHLDIDISSDYHLR